MRFPAWARATSCDEKPRGDGDAAEQRKAVAALGDGDRDVRFLTQHVLVWVAATCLTQIKCQSLKRHTVGI